MRGMGDIGYSHGEVRYAGGMGEGLYDSHGEVVYEEVRGLR